MVGVNGMKIAFAFLSSRIGMKEYFSDSTRRQNKHFQNQLNHRNAMFQQEFKHILDTILSHLKVTSKYNQIYKHPWKAIIVHEKSQVNNVKKLRILRVVMENKFDYICFVHWTTMPASKSR